MPRSISSPIKHVVAPQFSWKFLLPNYWLIWLGAFILFCLIQLPYPIIRKLGFGFGKLLKRIAAKRVFVAKRNIDLCFPHWSQEKREQVFQDNINRTGMALFETAMGWWWSSKRMQKHCKVEGFEKIQAVLDSGKGVFGLALHNVNVEFACRGIGYAHKSIAFYRKHDNLLLDYLQYHGRNRSNKYMIDKRNSKALIAAMNQGELCLYLPDQDYGPKQSIFVPFGGVEQTATTTATLMFASRTDAVPFLITSQYTDTGYVVKIVSDLPYLADINNNGQSESDQTSILTRLNADILSAVSEQPESYLWMHKRFKTRPKQAPDSLYR